MAKQKTSPARSNPGMKFVISFLALFGVNAATLYLANMFFPKFIVLGTHSLSPLWAILLSMGTLALLGTLAIPLAREIEMRRRWMLTSMEWMISYYVLDFIGLWIITRYSEQFGVGIRTWVVAAVLAVVLDFIQGVVMMALEKKFARTR